VHAEETLVANFEIPRFQTGHFPSIFQTDELQGIIMAVMRDDAGTYVRLRYAGDQDLAIRVRYCELADEMSSRVQSGMVSLVISGLWARTASGWLPVNDKSEAVHIIPLNGTTVRETLDQITAVASAGWNALEDPIAAWKELRGCE
jgi:hypothetical protein